MRAIDIHTTASVDETRRMVLLTGAIDSSEYAITMKIPVPESGAWTVVKAETNLTDTPWGLWQMTLGEDVSVVMSNGRPELLMSRNFDHARYIPDKNVVVFFGGRPVRPGETVLKFFKIHTRTTVLTMSHSARIGPDDPLFDAVVTGRYCGEDRPHIEMAPVVQAIRPPEIWPGIVEARSS